MFRLASNHLSHYFNLYEKVDILVAKYSLDDTRAYQFLDIGLDFFITGDSTALNKFNRNIKYTRKVFIEIFGEYLPKNKLQSVNEILFESFSENHDYCKQENQHVGNAPSK